jgi:hypothetical protein
MTIISGIESDELKIRKSETRQAILNNDKIENKLHVVMVISNPCNYKRRYQLAKQFQRHMKEFDDIELYCTELVYSDQKFNVTEKDNKNHLQLRTNAAPLWAKENLIAITIKKLLPENWKAVAWIDADIEFLNPLWADYTLRILNGHKDIVQLFSHCVDMDRNENTMQIFNSFGYQYDLGNKYKDRGHDFWHPGYCVAITRKAYEKMGGIFEYSILGSGDYNMMMAILGCSESINNDSSNGYKQKLKELVKKCNNLRLGYVPSVCRHSYHGSKKNRQYSDRWKILVKHQYDPFTHIKKNEDGLLIPTDDCPKQLLNDILTYFKERNEDDI